MILYKLREIPICLLEITKSCPGLTVMKMTSLNVHIVHASFVVVEDRTATLELYLMMASVF